MDALLIAPPEARYVRAFSTREYLGLGYLASYLEQQGCEVEVHNCNCRTASSMELAIARAVEANPPVVGISVPTLPNLPSAVHVLRALRAAGYRGHITMGGHVPTFQYVEILDSMPGLDSIVRGEGEHTLLELVTVCKAGGDWTAIPGLAYRGAKEVLCSPPRTLIRDLDGLPFPRRALGEVSEKVATRTAEVASSRGCYANCAYCSVFSFYDLAAGKRYRWRSPDNVVAELEELVRRYGVHTIIFVDDNFMGAGPKGRQRATRIAQLIIEKGLELSLILSCRANDVDWDTFAKLKKAGLTRVFVGMESGVQSALDRLRKHVSVEQNLRAVQILSDLDIRWDLGFMIYDPDTTFEELQENVRFLRKNRLYEFKAATLLLNGLVVFPGTPVETQLRRDQRLERRTRDALEFMGARDSATDYDQALQFVNQTYSLVDPRARRMREMIDFAYEALTPVYDVIWPLLTEWEHWIGTATQICRLPPQRILAALGEDADTYHALLHWNRRIGLLVMNLLEDMIALVQEGKSLAGFQEMFSKRLAHFAEGGHAAGLSGAVRLAEEFLGRDPVSVTIDQRSWAISVARAGAADWQAAQQPGDSLRRPSGPSGEVAPQL